MIGCLTIRAAVCKSWLVWNTLAYKDLGMTLLPNCFRVREKACKFHVYDQFTIDVMHD